MIKVYLSLKHMRFVITNSPWLTVFQLMIFQLYRWCDIVIQSLNGVWCLTLCNPMNCSMLGSSVLHYLLEFAQIHVHWISDAIQPSNPLPPLSPFAFNISQHQRLFQWVSSLQQVDKVLELQLQHQSSQCILRVDFLEDWLVWSPCSPGDSPESSPAP